MKQIPKRTTIRLKRKILFIFTMLVCSFSLQAQVNIGSGATAQKFSALEITSNGKGGLRLPHMTTSQRDELTKSSEFEKEKNRPSSGSNPGLGLGLTIYNTDTNCTEYWNGYKWVSICLGTADIKLSSSNGCDPNNPPLAPAKGSDLENICEYIPSETPACTVSTGRAFEVSLAIGSSYATLETDNSTSGFRVIFKENNTSMIRNVVVRISSNCTGEFKDFIFQQEAATCTNTDTPTIKSTSTSLCSGGSVFAYVDKPAKDVNYVWTFGGTIVHTGTSFEIKLPGEYKVYSSLIGCGTPAIFKIESKKDSTAPTAIEISATNNGQLCKGGNVILSANTSSPVLWFHNGIPGSTNNPLSVSGADSAGEWFAVVSDNGCSSNSSKKIELKDNTNSGTALPVPTATINGQAMNGTITICKGGSIKLEITNSSSYPEGTIYEWFSNGKSIGKSVNTKYFYNIPNDATDITISVTATDQSGNCPNSQVSQKVKVNFTAPSATSINSGAPKVAICGGNDATLIATYTNGSNYEWIKDGEIFITGKKNTVTTSTPGKYSVRYVDGNGCWSKLSTSIEVIQSTPIFMSWDKEPTNAVKGSSVTYSVKSTPAANKYKWEVVSLENKDAIKSVTPLGDGSAVVVVYNSPAATSTSIIIKVTTEGELCGDATLSKTISLMDGCTEATSVNLTPKNDSNIILGATQNFSATSDASNVNGDLKYEWFVNNKSQGAASATNTFSFTPTATGTYDVSVQVTNSCTAASKNVKASVKITVDPDPTNIPIDDDRWQTYSFEGKTSFDVYQNFNSFCGFEEQRAPDFLDSEGKFIENNQFVYTFTNRNDFTNLHFVTIDNNGIIKERISDIANKKYTISFDKSVIAKASNLDNQSALIVKLYAIYDAWNGETKKLELTLKIKDCWDGCGAKVGLYEYKQFLCYNLGVAPNETADPFVSSKAIQGARYKWGQKIPATTQSQDEDPANLRIENWTDPTLYPYEEGNMWKESNDPCPTGYRIPTGTEWENILKYNKQTNTTLGWYPGYNPPKYLGGLMLGDNLFLPAAGARVYKEGLLTVQSTGGYYWASDYRNALIIQHEPIFVTFYGPNDIPEKGYSVRCIKK